MLRHRIIPALLLKDGGLHKTTRFQHSRYIGDPVNAIRIFNEKEVDELILLDTEASRSAEGPDLRTISEIVGECFMPLTYGGGVRSLRDAEAVLSLGVEKISLQSAAIDDPSLITSIADHFGAQSVVISIDVIRGRLGRQRMLGARQGKSNRDWREFMGTAIAAGAGEILLTAVDREGTMSGMDTDLIQSAAALTTVPLIAHGGVGCLQDITAGLQAGADAVAIGAFAVFKGPRRAVLISYPDYESANPT